jgi:hypothetical protein
MFIEHLSNEINKLKPIYQSEDKKPSADLLMEAMMRGGWAELVENNGGGTLSFGIKGTDGNLEIFQEYYIPDISPQNNLIGFLLSADDASDTQQIRIPVRVSHDPTLVLERELLEFFEALHLVIGHALEFGNEIEVHLN